jgi:hypothetical protein
MASIIMFVVIFTILTIIVIFTLSNESPKMTELKQKIKEQKF